MSKRTKQILVNLNMGKPKEKTVYEVGSSTLKITDDAVLYPVSAFLKRNLTFEDNVKIILIGKRDSFGYYEENVRMFKEEIENINKYIKAEIEIVQVVTDFKEGFSVHKEALEGVIDQIEDGVPLWADTTFGDKTTLIVAMSAISFAERHLGVVVVDLIYGKADFSPEGEPINTAAWTFSGLFFINSLCNRMESENPDNARQMIKKLMNI